MRATWWYNNNGNEVLVQARRRKLVYTRKVWCVNAGRNEEIVMVTLDESRVVYGSYATRGLDSALRRRGRRRARTQSRGVLVPQSGYGHGEML